MPKKSSDDPVEIANVVTVKTQAILGEMFYCKECGYIIEQNDMASWTQPSEKKYAAVMFGHPTDGEEAPFNSCKSGKIRLLENYSTGMLMHDTSHRAFLYWNYLGKLNWYDLPVDYIFISKNKKQSIVENSLHTSIFITTEYLGIVDIELPDASSFPPYGLDIFVQSAQIGTGVKIKGFPTDVWLTSRDHGIVGCWCGELVGYKISSGNYLTSEPTLPSAP